MNLIQQAEQRRAELGRAGELRQVRTGTAAPAVAHGVLPLAAHLPVRHSSSVHIDLERLEQMGYLVPNLVQSRIADDFRHLKRVLLSNVAAPPELAEGEEHEPRHEALILVTSALPGEGKTFCSINLAMSIAMGIDTSVLLVDADVLRPSVLNRLALPPSRGLLDVLADPSLDVADTMLATNVPKLSILPSGTPTPRASELLASVAMDKLMSDLASRYPDRLIVFDGPPLVPTTVGPSLAHRLGQVVMVVEASRTPRDAVAQAFAAVEACPIVLTLLNNCSARMAKRGYGYGYGSSMSYPPAE